MDLPLANQMPFSLRPKEAWVERREDTEMEMTLVNHIPLSPDSKAALDESIRAALGGYVGPWRVTLRVAEWWEGGQDWCVEVTRPGHVWTMRARANLKDPTALSRYILETVQPEQFGRGDGQA